MVILILLWVWCKVNGKIWDVLIRRTAVFVCTIKSSPKRKTNSPLPHASRAIVLSELSRPFPKLNLSKTELMTISPQISRPSQPSRFLWVCNHPLYVRAGWDTAGFSLAGFFSKFAQILIKNIIWLKAFNQSLWILLLNSSLTLCGFGRGWGLHVCSYWLAHASTIPGEIHEKLRTVTDWRDQAGMGGKLFTPCPLHFSNCCINYSEEENYSLIAKSNQFVLNVNDPTYIKNKLSIGRLDL